ncbi:trehalase [Nannochloropsis gaditana]|uniref:Trehalase n=1 Tax=Nannochloropsis gaditana TaxID=72520 RepID=W7TGI9_9STRA|nr:trehalase [Nannochloropsis gaditana]
MPMRVDPEVVLARFQALLPALRRDTKVLRAFLTQYFTAPGSDLVEHVPPDHSESPALLLSLADHAPYQRWAAELNHFWKQLCRKVSDDVFLNPQRYSILRRTHPVVIPGGRFRESYYWDSYWIVLGLLACDMKDTARGLVQNLLDDVANFGFVPNGGRIYYLNRSQPPLLSEMVLALVEHDPSGIDEAFVSEALAVLEGEYRFWMQDGERAITVSPPPPIRASTQSQTWTSSSPSTSQQAEPPAQQHVLNRYWTASIHPRPESFKEDLHHAGLADCAQGFYANIAAGAESGWDFSSRWISPCDKGEYALERITTTDIIPVDLNTFLYRMERNMARLHDYLLARQMGPGCGTPEAKAEPPRETSCKVPPDSRESWVSPKAQKFAEASAKRALAIDQLMWDQETGMWRDLWMPASGRGASNLFTAAHFAFGKVRPASNFLPLWGRVLDNPTLCSVASRRKLAALDGLARSGLIVAGGVRTTNVETKEQWDCPNAWSPIVHMIIDGLENLGAGDADRLARSLAKAWLESNYLGWASTGYMYEKYNGKVPGARGEGGEYYPQVGFGWTNGVVLHLLKTYGQFLKHEAAAPPSTESPAEQ